MAYHLQPQNVRYTDSGYCGRLSGYETLTFDKPQDAFRFKKLMEEVDNREWVVYDGSSSKAILGKPLRN